MATNPNDVEITVTANASDVAKAESAIKAAFSGIEKAGKGVNSLSFSGVAGKLFSFNQAVQAAQTALGALKAGFDFVEAGDKVTQLTSSFRDFQAAAGRDGVAALDELRGATKGLVSDISLLETANKALATGIPADAIAELASSAQRLGQAVGRDATEAFNDLAVGISRGSAPILDNLGLLVKAEAAYEAYAAANNKTAEDLTEVEKKQAFLNATLEATREKLAKLGPAQETVGQEITRLGVFFENLQSNVQIQLSQNDSLRESLKNLSTSFKQIDPKFLADGIALLADAFVSVVGVAADAAQVLGDVSETIGGDFTNDFGRGILAIDEFIKQFPLVSFAADEAIASISDLAAVIDGDFNNALGRGIVRIGEYIDSLLKLAQNAASAVASIAQSIAQDLNAQLEQIPGVTEFADRVLAGLDDVGQLGVQAATGVASAVDNILGSTSEAISKNIAVDTQAITTNVNQLAAATGKQAEAAGNLVSQLENTGRAATNLAKSTGAATEAGKENVELSDKQKRELEKLRKEQERLNQEYTTTQNKLLQIASNTDVYQQAIKDVEAGVISQADANKILLSTFEEVKNKATQLEGAQKRLDDAFLKNKTGALTDDAKEAITEVERLKTELEGIGEIEPPKGFFDDLFGKDFTTKLFGNLDNEIYGPLIEGLAGAVQDGFENGFGRDTFSDLFSGAIGTVGAGLGVPFLDQIAKPITDTIFNFGKSTAQSIKASLLALGPIGATAALIPDSFFENLFGESAGTSARKAADKFFADALDANRLQLVINGELQEITDLQFLGNQSGEGLFAGLSQEAQAAFQGIGTALQENLGIGAELGLNLASVLANNLGGSLNNVQILLKRIGLSAEELVPSIEEAFLAGELGATEAQNALVSVEQLAQSGIPGAVGATQEAFQNLINSAGRGAAAVDALGDIQAEATDKGITSLEQLRADLKESGQFAGDQIDTFINSLASTYGDAFFDLEEVGTSAAIAIAASLESAGFAFGPVVDELNGIKETLEAIPRVKDVTVNVRTNISQEDRDVLRQVNGGSAEFSPA